MICPSKLSEPETYPRDLPKAEVDILDAGHFALDTAADEIAALDARFFFGRDIERMITLCDLEALGDLASRIRA